MYSPSFSAPTRMYSPSPRVYTTPGFSGGGPAHHAPMSPSFSAPRMSAPQHFMGAPGRR
jgi:hypothetical protein